MHSHRQHPRAATIFGVILVALSFATCAAADSVDDYLRDAMQHHPIPGAALAIVRGTNIVKNAGYGMANLENHTPVTTDTAFEIGSMTKQFTAAGILLLAQDRKLSVDDRISTFLKGTPTNWYWITLRHLMTHTSGLKNYTGLDGFELTRHLTQAQFISKMAAYPLDFKPGDKWAYCNTSYNLLGWVIENVSGKSYAEFLQERIFAPLHMTNTALRAPGVVLPGRASGYETNRAGQFVNRDPDVTDVFSAGALVSTVGDLAKWNAALDTNLILSSESLRQMWTPVRLNDGTRHPYGFGWFLSSYQGHANVGHSGSTDGFSASLQRFPEAGLTVILLSNSDEFDIATKLAKEIGIMELK